MANVLPIEEKKRVMRAARSRFVLTASLALLISAAIALASLLPALISVRLAKSAIPEEAPLSGEARDDQAKHARALALTTAISPIVLATTTPSASVVAALSARPAGVSVTSVSYSKGRLLITGTSRDRQAVNDYREALETDARFTSVSVPVAALIGTQDGRFTITLGGSF